MMKQIALILATATVLCSCHRDNTLFVQLPSSHTGITFNNRIIENDSINPLDLEFLYNGGGVAVGDFNNDGLLDLYFTGSTVGNKLYLNEGDLKFKDITQTAGVDGNGEWSNAASVVDINNDGLEDIYVCTTIKTNPEQRRNLLYINQGVNKDKIPVFKQMASEYGLSDTAFSVHAGFFDYDNDGDLDMYLVTTRLVKRESVSFSANTRDTTGADIDKLYRNDWNDSLGHPVFTDVSKAAGITERGFGLGMAITDINGDGWKDIYVTNDYYGSDHLYINNRNGTFTDKIRQYFKHTSQNAMGNDVADINNDGLPDVVALDMDPKDNYRRKKNMSGTNYYIYQKMMYENLELQYVRNTLQLNMGPTVSGGDSTADPIFADISFYAGVAETDWSWNASLADFDNDGYRDLIITNGYPRDVTDHDFIAFRNLSSNVASKKQIIDQIPQIKIPNYAFRNTGNLKFEDETAKWGMDQASFSNGAVYADLDNDGDLDYVINNINDEAFVYENTVNSKDKINANYLEVRFKGDKQNINGLGAIATIYYDNGKLQRYENSPYRGYLSTVDDKAYFGLGKVTDVDSVVIDWGKLRQVIQNVKANQVITADIAKAGPGDDDPLASQVKPLFTDITNKAGIHYTHHEMDYIDFDDERLIPHKLSQYGPGLAAGDIDGNGLDDIYVGGTGDFTGRFFLQQKDGSFQMKDLNLPTGKNIRHPENMGLLLFDADNDGDDDLYCASGSDEWTAGTQNYQDQFFVNDGRGNYTLDTNALPRDYTSKSCVKAADIDNDGDLDLFIGGRILPGRYPQPVNSFIYRNDSKPGKIKFTDITGDVAKDLRDIGLVCDAVWTDFDGDGWTDLIIVGEWMPVTFLHNVHGTFKNVTASSGIAGEKGWWNSIAAGDFDNDGDMDYIVGNLGENSFFRASDQYPVGIYAKDFDNNGSFDAIPTLYLPDEQGKLREFTAHNRDDIVEQLPMLKKKFLSYKAFATADIHQVFTEDQLKGALHLQANMLKSALIRNMGNGKFQIIPLPTLAQMAPVFGIVTGDFNHDGNLDAVLSGNDYGNEVTNGRYDAFDGLVLLGDGNGQFRAENIRESGIYIPGDGKALIKLRSADGGCLIAASQNRGPLKLFSESNTVPMKNISLRQDDKAVLLHLKNGKVRKEETCCGNSFLSQSSPFITIDDQVKSVDIISANGAKRSMNF